MLLRFRTGGRVLDERLPRCEVDWRCGRLTELAVASDAAEARFSVDDSRASDVSGWQGGVHELCRVELVDDQSSRSMLIECRTTGATT